MIHADQHTPAPATPATPAVERSVDITDVNVVPHDLVVAPGTEITWGNVGRNRHTSTSDAGLWDSPSLFPGDHFTITAPATPGVYAYHCRFHSYIRGTVTVSLLSLGTPASVLAGNSPMLTGTAPGMPAGTIVTIEQRVPGAWEPVGQDATDASGSFEVVGPALSARTAFRAVTGDDISPSVRAEVRPAVIVRRSGARVALDVRPAGPGRARLERLNLDTYRWREVAMARITAGRARFTLRSPGVYRAMVEAGRGLSAGVSRVVLFRPGPFIE